ncbi:MAG: galactokinase [Actinobacteria bacterium]|nr:galactokinase [Actinomycetota bacterium]
MTAFADVFGREPELGWRSPGRVNLIGEHTDYNDGFVLPLALEREVRVLAAPRGDGLLRLASAQTPGPPVEVVLDGLAPGAVEGWAAYVAGTAWALQGHGVDLVGADVLVDGDVPRGAGLSSSAALECASAGALLALAGAELPLVEVALLAQRAENDFVGMPCGVMDQFASTHGRAGALLLLDTRSLEARTIPFDLAAEGLRLVVIDTRAPHRLVDGEYAARRASCEQAAVLLGVPALRDVDDLGSAMSRLDDDVLQRRVRHVVTENARVLDVVALLESGDVRAIGPLLTASHESLRDDYEVSCPELDVAVEAALSAGAHGARMTGGGFGGSAIALVEASGVDALRRDVAAAFASAGFTEPAFLEAVPADGYRRLQP